MSNGLIIVCTHIIHYKKNKMSQDQTKGMPSGVNKSEGTGIPQKTGR